MPDPTDIAQETLTTAWRYRGSYQPLPGHTLSQWIFTIFWNKIRTHWRTKKLQPMEPLEDWDGEDKRTPEQKYQAKEQLELLEQLDPDKARLLIMAGYGMGYTEMAQAEGLCLGTVRSKLSRAREEFKQILEGEYAEV